MWSSKRILETTASGRSARNSFCATGTGGATAPVSPSSCAKVTCSGLALVPQAPQHRLQGHLAALRVPLLGALAPRELGVVDDVELQQQPRRDLHGEVLPQPAETPVRSSCPGSALHCIRTSCSRSAQVGRLTSKRPIIRARSSGFALDEGGDVYLELQPILDAAHLFEAALRRAATPVRFREDAGVTRPAATALFEERGLEAAIAAWYLRVLEQPPPSRPSA